MKEGTSNLRKSFGDSQYITFEHLKIEFEKILLIENDFEISSEELFSFIYINKCICKAKRIDNSKSKSNLNLRNFKFNHIKNINNLKQNDDIKRLHGPRDSVDVGQTYEWDEKTLLVDGIKFCNLFVKLVLKIPVKPLNTEFSLKSTKKLSEPKSPAVHLIDDNLLKSAVSKIYRSLMEMKNYLFESRLSGRGGTPHPDILVGRGE